MYEELIEKVRKAGYGRIIMKALLDPDMSDVDTKGLKVTRCDNVLIVQLEQEDGKVSYSFEGKQQDELVRRLIERAFAAPASAQGKINVPYPWAPFNPNEVKAPYEVTCMAAPEGGQA